MRNKNKNKKMSSFRVAVFWFIVSSFFCSSVLADEVKVIVNTGVPLATTNDPFICATMDWWPSSKCNYDYCTWTNVGLPYLDLSNKILNNAVKAFKGLRVRIGGSLQDQILYKVGNLKDCPDFKDDPNATFGYTGGCLTMEKWDEFNNFYNRTGVIVSFGLNALNGRQKSPYSGTLWVGDWDSQNARDLIIYTVQKGYNVDSWELGNELCGWGVGARIDAQQYAKDMIQLKNIINDMYPPLQQAKVLGPGGFYDQNWFNQFLQSMGPGVVDGVTIHVYNLGAGVDKTLIDKVQNPYYLQATSAPTFSNAAKAVELFSPMAGVWIGEAGGSFNSGGKDVSNTFANGFWFLDQLGMSSTFNHKVYCRQALVGGNYALLNLTTFIPNPDYYNALLWHRLMGSKVLATTHSGSPYLRAYAHCSKTSKGITLVLINMAKSATFDVSVIDDLNILPGPAVDRTIFSDTPREEYHLTPEDGNIRSDVVLLNGTPLKLTKTSDIPDLKPKLVDPFATITVAPYSIVFATLKGFIAPACGW